MDENNVNLDDLSRQLEMLEDLPTEDILGEALGVQTTQQSVGVPQTPENPLNQGIVTNTIQPNTIQQVPMQPQPQGVFTNTTGTIPVQQVVQQQVNQQAQAQVVQPSTTQIPTAGLSQPIQQMTSQVVQPIKPLTEDELSLFDNEEDPVFVNVGEDNQDERIPFVTLKGGESTRIMLITLKMLPVYTHYHKDLGFFRCLSKRQPNGWLDNSYEKAPCCKFINPDTGKEAYASLKRILPVIEYPVSKDGKSLVAGKQPQLKFLVLTKPDYDNLKPLLEDEAQREKIMNSCDFTISVEDSKFKKKTFTLQLNTLRANFTDIIKEEIKKLTPELFAQARDEQYKKIPASRIQEVLEKEQQLDVMANTMMNQQSQVAPLDELLQ